jgi:hypothetical protein
MVDGATAGNYILTCLLECVIRYANLIDQTKIQTGVNNLLWKTLSVSGRIPFSCEDCRREARSFDRRITAFGAPLAVARRGVGSLRSNNLAHPRNAASLESNRSQHRIR